MARDEIAILIKSTEEEIRGKRNDWNTHRNYFVALFAGLSSIFLSSTAIIQTSQIRFEDIFHICPFFIGMFWISVVAISSTLVYQRDRLVDLEDHINEINDDFLPFPEDIIHIIVVVVALASSVISILLIEQFSIIYLLYIIILISSIILISVTIHGSISLGFSKSIMISILNHPNENVQSMDVKNMRQKYWTISFLGMPVLLLIISIIMLIIAWQISPRVEFFILGTSSLIFLLIIENCYRQYHKLIEYEMDLNELIKLKNELLGLIVADSPTLKKIFDSPNSKCRLDDE